MQSGDWRDNVPADHVSNAASSDRSGAANRLRQGRSRFCADVKLGRSFRAIYTTYAFVR